MARCPQSSPIPARGPSLRAVRTPPAICAAVRPGVQQDAAPRPGRRAAGLNRPLAEPVFLEFEAAAGGVAGRLEAGGWAARRWNRSDGEAYDLLSAKIRAPLRGMLRGGRLRGWSAHLSEAFGLDSRAAAEGRFLIRLAHLPWTLQVPFALTAGWRAAWVRRGDVARLERRAGVDAERFEFCRCGCAARRSTVLVSSLGEVLTQGWRCCGASCVVSRQRHARTQPSRLARAPCEYGNFASRLAQAFVDEAARSKALALQMSLE